MNKDAISAKSVLNYEINKINFYKKNNQEIGPVITDEYCEYEEKKYGDNLSKIYKKISDIREGKKIVNNVVIQIILVTILFARTLKENPTQIISLFLSFKHNFKKKRYNCYD